MPLWRFTLRHEAAGPAGTLKLQYRLPQEDVTAAVAFVEKEVRRLLEGRVELSEMVMTGGLWRVTGAARLKTSKPFGTHLSAEAALLHSCLLHESFLNKQPGLHLVFYSGCLLGELESWQTFVWFHCG